MFFLLKTLNNFLKLLNSETSPSQLSAGVAFGMIVGLTPFLSLHNLIIFFVVCLLRVNFSMFFLSLAGFKIVGFLADPFFDWLGYALLVHWESARPFWIAVTTGPLLPFFKFNNTIVMGSLFVSIVLWIPIFVFFVWFVKAYRQRYRERIQKSAFMKALKATPIYGLYEKYQAVRTKLSVFQ